MLGDKIACECRFSNGQGCYGRGFGEEICEDDQKAFQTEIFNCFHFANPVVIQNNSQQPCNKSKTFNNLQVVTTNDLHSDGDL